jgi:hypothetical protein
MTKNRCTMPIARCGWQVLIVLLATGGCQSKGETELAGLTQETDKLAERLDRAVADRNREEVEQVTAELNRVHAKTEGLVKKIRQGIDTGNEYRDMQPQLSGLQELAARQQTLLGRVRR